MAGPDRRSSMGIDRRGSIRPSLQLNDHDDYDIEAMGISDGFRPSEAAAGHNRMHSQGSQHYAQFTGRRTPPPRPSSTTKPKRDSFALRHDGAMGTLPSRTSSAASTSRTSTERAYVRAEIPYEGPVGPSHPYQMYPQESRLARTASIATASTVQISERSYSGPNGPAHPYGMYPQNIVPEADDANEGATVLPVPVGFPGRNDNYQRRLGPEGEEIADIIGPDGHTEQLPPYTQYPDEAFARKARPTVQTMFAGAGGMGLATRNPEFASREDLDTPHSRQSTRSFMSDSNHQINTAALGVSEKPELKRWQKIAKRRVCGIIPIWAFVLVGITFVIFAIVVASVLAVLIRKHPPKHHENGVHSGPPQSIVVTTMTTTFDATPLTTIPANIQTLPTGTFELPITTPSIAPASCLVDPSQSNSWSCAIQPALPYQITVSNIAESDGSSENQITLDYGNYSLDFLPFGAQPPVLEIPKDLRLVNDSTYPERGPAWFFQVTYDKIVVLPENALVPPTAKRDGNYPTGNAVSDFMGRKGVAQPGDMPWICYWNSTLLEAFIYVNQTSNSANLPSGATTSRYSVTSTYPSSVPTSSARPSGYPTFGETAGPSFLPSYPKVFKLEERRVPIDNANPPTPYCVQNVVNTDGTYYPRMEGNKPVTLSLNETVPSIIAPMSGRSVTYDSVKERDASIVERQSNSICGCVWLKQ